MNINQNLTGRKVTIESGEETLTGTVTRTSPTSVWAVFGDHEYRFVRSQDGNLRRHGRSADRFSPVLTFVPEAPVAPETAAPVTFPASDAEQATSWLLDLEDPSERNRLYSGHRARRHPGTSPEGFRITDHSEADAWLVKEWKKATAAPVEAPTEQEALLALATSLDEARIAANAIESAAWQMGVYGDIQKALISTLTLIRGGHTDRAERVHDIMLESGLTVTEGLTAEQVHWEHQSEAISDLLNPSWGE